MREIVGGGVPPPLPRQGERWSVVSPRPGEPLELVVVGNTWLGMDCHWWTPPQATCPRSTLCLAPQACICLSEVVPDKWHGYLAVALWRTGRPAVLSLTQLGVDCLIDAAGDVKTLRGIPLVLARQSSHRSSKISATKNPKRWTYRLPDSFDLLPSLEPVFGVKEIAIWKSLYNLQEARL